MRRVVTVLSTAVCAVGLMAAPALAGAAAPVHVSLTPAATRVTAGAEQTYRYHATNLRKGTRLVLQDYEGTWETRATSVKKHGTVDGTFHIAGPTGPFVATFRVVALRHGAVDASSAHHTVFVYGRVGLGALCRGVLHESVVAKGDSCANGSADAGHGTTFRYAMVTGETTPDQGYRPQFGAPGTSCRSISLRWVNDVGGAETLELRQQGAKPVTHPSSGSGVARFHTALTGSKFGVSVAEDDNDLFTEFNGSASCYSIDGAR